VTSPEPDLPGRPSPEQQRALRLDRERSRTLNVMELLVVERALHYCEELVKLVAPAGRLSGHALRPRIDREARRLIATLTLLDDALETPRS
jgi:hypothetical protein